MAFCSKCGSAVQEGQAFCPQCGASVAPPPPQQPFSAPPPPQYAPPYAAAGNGLQENVASMLCYLAGWVTGIVFLIIDKRPTVRFHAAQSIVFFGGLTVLNIAVSILFSTISYHLWMIAGLLHLAIGIVGLVGWIWLMLTAYQGRTVEVPIAGGIARSLVNSVKV